ncbi:hypothetical protein BgiBS90_015845 [Biomphalaria glabrata]|nr:hypothetical protein BgiBS90_015845 [Biomphalaria glabrata]
MGSQYSVTGQYGHTFSFPVVMGSQDSVTGPYGHTFSFPNIMGSHDSVTSPTVYGNTISFSVIMGSQYSVTGPYGYKFSFSEIMGSEYSSPGHMATHGHYFAVLTLPILNICRNYCPCSYFRFPPYRPLLRYAYATTLDLIFILGHKLATTSPFQLA